MKKLFGAKKQEAPKEPPPTLHDTSAKVKGSLLNQNIARRQTKGDLSKSGRMQLAASLDQELNEDGQGDSLQESLAKGARHSQEKENV